MPETTEIKIHPMKDTLIRDGIFCIVNPFGGYALKAAAHIKDKNPDTKIIVLFMGIPPAVATLKECLAIDSDIAQVGPGASEHLGYPQTVSKDSSLGIIHLLKELSP